MSIWTKWTKRAITVKAMQFDPESPVDWPDGMEVEDGPQQGMYTFTLPGIIDVVAIAKGDYLVTDIHGKVFALDQDTFHETYDPAGDDDALDRSGPQPTEDLPHDSEITIDGTIEAIVLDISRRVGAGEILHLQIVANDANRNIITAEAAVEGYEAPEGVAKPAGVRMGAATPVE